MCPWAIRRWRDDDSIATLGYRSVFIACAILTAAALPLVLVSRTKTKPRRTLRGAAQNG